MNSVFDADFSLHTALGRNNREKETIESQQVKQANKVQGETFSFILNNIREKYGDKQVCSVSN